MVGTAVVATLLFALVPEGSDKPDLPHKGGFADIRVGTIGCTKKLCKDHGGKPGFRIDGGLGYNIAGYVDVGLFGGWGSMGASVEPGTNALSLYGLDVSTFPDVVADMVNNDALIVQDAKLDTVQAGFNVRVHFIPRGRVDPYIGAAAGYHMFRARYDTEPGRTRVALHGLGFPLQVGFLAYVHRNIAVGVQFDYVLTWYGAVSVRGAAGDFGAPLSRVEERAKMAGFDVGKDLPHLWTVGAVGHFRFGR